jgi:hypothetical protein
VSYKDTVVREILSQPAIAKTPPVTAARAGSILVVSAFALTVTMYLLFYKTSSIRQSVELFFS